ncbi:MAG: hypothetical protein ACK5U7_13785 [Bacteroidota bacterium]
MSNPRPKHAPAILATAPGTDWAAIAAEQAAFAEKVARESLVVRAAPDLLSVVREFVRLCDDGFVPRDADGNKRVDTDAAIEAAREVLARATTLPTLSYWIDPGKHVDPGLGPDMLFDRVAINIVAKQFADSIGVPVSEISIQNSHRPPNAAFAYWQLRVQPQNPDTSQRKATT